MRVLVISDTHGELGPLRDLPGRVGPVDWLLHAGDFKGDGPQVARLFGVPADRLRVVAGNCDYPEKEPLEELVHLGGVRILLTHGHKYDVKRTLQRIYYRALEVGARVAVFGHSHLTVCADEGGVLLFNPGSPSFPRAPAPASCGLLEIHDGQVLARHIPV